MTINIFKSFQLSINVGIFVGIIVFIILLIFIIIKIKKWRNYKEKERKRKEETQSKIIKIKRWYDYREKEIKHKEEIESNVDIIIEASKKWSVKDKINNCNYFLDEYERLLKCQEKPIGAGYATDTIITVFVNGRLDYFGMDINGLYTLYCYMKNEVEDR